MGIDKPNIRNLFHFGMPATLESYYQQVGRAGRDGLPSTCTLFWGPGDVRTLDAIKLHREMTDVARKSYLMGLNKILVRLVHTH